MRELEIVLPARKDDLPLEKMLDDAIIQIGLQIVLRGSLRKYPGCTHWHLKRGNEPGTLEITFWPKLPKAWFTIQSRRDADWIDRAMQLLTEKILELGTRSD